MQPDDRVLVTPTPDHEWLRAASRTLTRGLLVVIDHAGAIGDGRVAFRDVDNVLFVPADPGGTLPWADGFFTKVLVSETTAEIQRVLAK